MSDIVNFTTKDLDYDSIVTNLRNFMRYQDEFTDYDFTGSALSTLINTLAYNTHYNGVYDNFAINESFLDSAVKRASVISHANLVNYTPRSATAATAEINITVFDDNIESQNKTFTLPGNSLFTTSIDGVQYSFCTESDIVFNKNFTTFTANNVVIKQGTVIKTQQTYNGGSNQKFVLYNNGIDIDTLKVQVLHGVDLYTFTRATDIIDIDNTSKVYFLTMNGNGQYQIQFGSGMMGFSLSAGDAVYISYLVTDGSVANNAGGFVYAGTASTLGFSSSATMKVVCISKSAGGNDPEDTESIRLLAPKMYTVQNRCVTESDYQTIIKSLYGNAKSVKVWGGEKNNPPQYGKVFVSIIPKQGLLLSEAEKDIVLNIVDSRRVVGTGGVEIIDPAIINIHVNTTVYYDRNKSINTEQDIETMARNAILAYSDRNLGNFSSVMRFSQLSRVIDDCDGNLAVQNNSTRIQISSTIQPQFNTLIDYTLDMSNAIYKHKMASESVLSTGFYCTQGKNKLCYIDDDPAVNALRLFYLNEDNKKVVLQNAGTVDYSTGVLTIQGIEFTSLDGTELRFTIDPSSNDVITKQNQFAVISNSDLIVNAVSVTSDGSYVQVSNK